MVAQPASVPAVRRFVDDALTTWGRAELIDDIALSATELATNATLHSQGTFFDVELRASSDAVRVTVVDTGAMPAQSIALRADLDAPTDDDLDLALESMTGSTASWIAICVPCSAASVMPFDGSEAFAP